MIWELENMHSLITLTLRLRRVALVEGLQGADDKLGQFLDQDI